MARGERMKTLENVVAQMLQPIRNIPFDLVIKALSGKRAIPFDPKSKKDKKLLQDLSQAMDSCARTMRRKGVRAKRPNEIGNYIEQPVKDALNEIGYKATTPATSSGRQKAAGYPDILFRDHAGRPNYLECKTYNVANVDTTQRAFYLSPSTDFKVTYDARHFLIAFAMEQYESPNRERSYRPIGYKILTLNNILCDVKYEFNSDNRRLYSQGNLLFERNFPASSG